MTCCTALRCFAALLRYFAALLAVLLLHDFALLHYLQGVCNVFEQRRCRRRLRLLQQKKKVSNAVVK